MNRLQSNGSVGDVKRIRAVDGGAVIGRGAPGEVGVLAVHEPLIERKSRVGQLVGEARGGLPHRVASDERSRVAEQHHVLGVVLCEIPLDRALGSVAQVILEYPRRRSCDRHACVDDRAPAA